MILNFIILFFTLTCAEKVTFDNFSVYKAYPENADQVELLKNVMDSNDKYDFWTDPVQGVDFVNIMSGPEDKEWLENYFNANNIKSEITIPNVQELINKESVGKYTRNNFRSMRWDAYYTMADIESWLNDLATSFPTIVTPLIGGSTVEGRQIRGIKISHGSGRRVIFLEGGIHSREWISPATVNYITEQLLTSNDEETRNAARDFDWYIFPVTNPDGYIWSHDSNRMWRKNRRVVTINSTVSYGIDLNRNWGNNWMVAGASSNPSSDSYAGPEPFSETETKSLSEFILTIADEIDMYLSFHSFSQLLLLPFGNSTGAYGNYYEAMNIGRRAMGALSVRYGTQYITGNVAEAIYLATGGSIDWVKGELNVPLVYCYELRDRGTVGFLLPTEQILPNNEEAMDSVLELIHQAKRFGVMSSAFKLNSALLLIVTCLLWKLF